MAWRYYAQRITTGEWLDRDLVLNDVDIDWELSGPGGLTATVDEVLAREIAGDGYLILDEWSTAIYAESDGFIRWGGLLSSSSEEKNGARELDAVGFAGYPKGRVYEGVTVSPVGHKYYWEADVFDIVRMLWDEVQHDEDGDLGVIVDGHKSGTTVGDPDPGPKPKREDYDSAKEHTKALTKWQTNYGEPYELAWWNTPDIGSEIDNIMETAGADYVEEHVWKNKNKDEVEHRIRLGRPKFGRRRFDLRFMEGENVIVPPSVSRDGEAYANFVIALGAGEDRHMLRRKSGRNDRPRLRRDKVVSAKDVKNFKTLKSMADNEHTIARDMVYFDSVEVFDHPNAPIGSWELGDEILLQTFTGFERLNRWARITGWSFSPEDGDRATLQVTRL